MGVEAAGVAAEAGRPEVLAVGRGDAAAAEISGERLMLLLADQTPQRRCVGFLADVPVSRCIKYPDTVIVCFQLFNPIKMQD